MCNNHFEILPSKFLQYWNLGIHALAVLVLLFLHIDIFIKLFFIILIIASCIFSKPKKSAIYALEHIKEEEWKLFPEQDLPFNSRLLKKNYISDFLLILRFGSDNHKETLFLLRHQFSGSHWRSLQRLVRY